MSRDVYSELKEARHDVCIIQENISLLKKSLKHLIDLEHLMEDNNLDFMGETKLIELRDSIRDMNKCYQTNKVYYRHYSEKVKKLKLDVKEYNRHQQRAVKSYNNEIFDRDNIISNTKDAIIGDYYYFSTSISHLEDVVKHKNSEFFDRLRAIDFDHNKFYMENGYAGWDYLYPNEDY